MVLGTVRREAEPHERWLKALKTELTQRGHQALVYSDGSRDGQARGWTALEVAKALKGSIGKQL
jgi:hypothetical protein